MKLFNHPPALSACLALLPVLILLAACQSGASLSAAATPANVVRVGYFANLTHSQALIGLARGDFQQALGNGVQINPTVFNAGPAVIEALFAGQIDLAYVGPNPAINGFVQSKGEALRIVAGATSGGASLVVRPAANIHSGKDLAGKRIASPQLGNTQDVALRSYIAANGLQTKEKGGSVEVLPTQNSQIIDLFKLGQIDGAWVPEPWASRLVVEAGGQILVDERDLWPGGEFVSAEIIVHTAFLKANPGLVKAWLKAHVDLTLWENAHPAEAQQLVNTQIEALTGKKLDEQVLKQAWQRLRVTWDPLAPALKASAMAAYKAGFLRDIPDLTGIYDLALLNEVLSAAQQPAVSEAVSQP